MNKLFFVCSDEIKEIDPDSSYLKVISAKLPIYSKVKVTENKEIFISKGKNIIIPSKNRDFKIEVLRYSYDNGVVIEKTLKFTNNCCLDKDLKKILKSEQKLLPVR